VRTSLIDPAAISIQDSVDSFSEAISLSTQLLVKSGHAKASYVSRVMENFERLGPYFVVAPAIALAHAAPGEDVVSPGLSLLKLNQPVVSGALENDPVSLLFSLCTPDSNSHIDLMGEFAKLMGDPEIVNSLLNASAESVIREIFQG